MKFEIDLDNADLESLDLICNFFRLDRKAAVSWLVQDQLEYGSNAIPALLKSASCAAMR